MHILLIKFFVFKHRFCIDNGVMIAHTGALMHKSGYKTKWEDTFCTQRYLFYLFT